MLLRVGSDNVEFVGTRSTTTVCLLHGLILLPCGISGKMTGVMFHSCRPSFRHTGVMFPDFAFLTRSGDLWDPLDSSL